VSPVVESQAKKVISSLLVKASQLTKQDDDGNSNLSKTPVDRTAAMTASKESSRNLAGAHLARASP